MCAEDNKALEILKTIFQNVCGNYNAGLVWENHIREVPESYRVIF